jgi:hypothetical protein
MIHSEIRNGKAAAMLVRNSVSPPNGPDGG